MLLAIGGAMGDLEAKEGQMPDLWQLRGIAHLQCGKLDAALDCFLRAAWLGKKSGQPNLSVPKVDSVSRLATSTASREQLQLWKAAKQGRVDRVQSFVKQGADVNWRNPDVEGMPAVFFAAATGNLAVVQYLVEEQKANLIGCSNRGRCVLEIAKQGNSPNAPKVVAYLKRQMFAAAGSLDHYLDITEAFERYEGLSCTAPCLASCIELTSSYFSLSELSLLFAGKTGPSSAWTLCERV